MRIYVNRELKSTRTKNATTDEAHAVNPHTATTGHYQQ